jgi:hypothetical protein
MNQRSVYLDIGGINISVSLKDLYRGEISKTPYDYFIKKRDKIPDLKINVEIDSPPPFNKKGGIFFDTKYSWKMFHLGKGYLYKDRKSDDKRSDGSEVRYAEIDTDFRKATVYPKSRLVKKVGLVNCALDLPLGHFLMTNILAEKEGLTLHCCGIKYKDKGLIFMGPPDSGKSTMAGLWRGIKDATVLSDERIILRRIKGKLWIYGTPWTGTERASSNERAVVNRIYLIEHSKENFIKAIDAKKALPTFLTNIRLPLWDRDKTERISSMADSVLSSVPFFRLGFRPDKKIIDLVLSS